MQYDIIYSTEVYARSTQDYLNLKAIEESKALNGRKHSHNRVVSLFKRMSHNNRA